jgi:hypothetical protein
LVLKLRPLTTRKKFMYGLATTLFALMAIELFSAAVVSIRDDPAGGGVRPFPLVNFAPDRSDGENPARRRYRSITDGYFVYDATLGVRFRPGSWAVALEADERGAPRIDETRRLAVDDHGFIANVSDVAARRDYAALAADASVYRILVSGGSTTAWGASDNEHTWPAVLERLLRADRPPALVAYRDVIVINGGVFGYGLSQELRRYVDDTSYLRPDFVVAFNGINERWTGQTNPVDFATNGRQRLIVDPLNFGRPFTPPVLLPYTVKLIHDLAAPVRPRPNDLLGFRRSGYPTSPVENLYIAKVRQFHALCADQGTRFVHCFQPIMGMDEKRLTPREESLMSFFNSDFYAESWERYVERGTGFYARVRPLLAEPFMHDLSGIFDEVEETVYSDPRHYNDSGHELVARAVDRLIRRTLESSEGLPATPHLSRPAD